MGSTLQNKRVLLICTTVGVGGTERIVLSLARELAARQFCVRTLLPDYPDISVALSWFHEEGVFPETSFAIHPFRNPLNGFRLMSELRRYVRSTQAEVVNLHYGGCQVSLKDVLAVRLAGRMRCVATVHHALPIRTERDRRVNRLAARLAHRIVVTTDISKGFLQEAGVPADKIEIIPCGIPIPARFPSRAEMRARWGIPKDAFVVSSLARLMPHKGMADLIQAVAQVPDREGKLRLVIGGDGPERQHLESLAADLLQERALFTGRVKEASEVYAVADVFALASYEEGFGLVFIEAALQGVPSIGTDVGGVSRAILNNETGLLVPPGDPERMAAAIARLRDDPDLRRCLGEKASARAHAEFSEKIMAERYVKVLGI
jgi:glycosyltransferase involved in cell wall biosynthesis